MNTATSKQLTDTLFEAGLRVRFEYERYPQAELTDEVAFALSTPLKQKVKKGDIVVIGRQPQPLAVLKSFGVNLHRNGGRVTATILDADKNELGRGVSECSLNDIFVKESGRSLALARALESKENGGDTVGPVRPFALEPEVEVVGFFSVVDAEEEKEAQS